MTRPVLPPRSELVIHFAHVSYRLAERFALRNTGIEHFQTWDADSTRAAMGKGQVLVLSGLWHNGLLEHCANVAYIQVSAAGFNQFDLEGLRTRGIRLANGSGVNKNAVSEHALGLMLSFTRLLHTTRDFQRQSVWRDLISPLAEREDELAGKTLLIYGLGAIGSRLARLAKAFEMHVIGIKRNPASHETGADEVHPSQDFLEQLPRADFVVLCCPLNDATRHLMNDEAFARMAPTAYFINVARGGCVDETALVHAMQTATIAGAGIDTTEIEPLPAQSPLWLMENVIITPHTAGETRKYEDNVADILIENLNRLASGRDDLVNQVL